VASGQSGPHGQRAAVAGQGNQLVPLLVHSQQVPAVGEHGEPGEALPDGDLRTQPRPRDIDDRYATAPVVGHAQRPAVVEKCRRHGPAQTGRRGSGLALGPGSCREADEDGKAGGDSPKAEPEF
jgi:hypothetical protein